MKGPRTARGGLAIAVVAAAIGIASIGRADTHAGDPAGRGGGTLSAGTAAASGAPAPSAPVVGKLSPQGPSMAQGTCVEHVPQGAAVPTITEEFPTRGTSGYVVPLRIVVQHGQGEAVLPEGFKLHADHEAVKALKESGFVLPDPEGRLQVTVFAAPGKGTTQTTVTIPFVALPPKPGRSVMMLPPLPIAVARANNEYVTICTKPHPIVVEDPIVNVLNPEVKPNPAPIPQRVDWPLARAVAAAIPLALLAAILGALGYAWWARRPKVVPEPPRIPPWEVAIGELNTIRRTGLVEAGKTDEYVARVNEVIRRYLGARYGFEAMADGYNGLETTTGEMLFLLERVRPPVVELPRIRVFLEECDLVKFARFTPSSSDCAESIDRGEKIVRRTMPTAGPPASSKPAPPPEVRPSP